jgi:hypothetical protein
MPTDIQVVFDCHHPDRQAAFWAAALGYVLEPPPPGFATWDEFLDSIGVPADERDASAVVDPEGKRPRIFFQRVPEDKVAKNRMHLDLAASGGRGVPLEQRRMLVDAEVARLKALGASDERGAREEGGGYWVRLNDPEGNEFCVH